MRSDIPVISYPPWLRWSLFSTAVIHDAAIMVAGWYSVQDAPRTILIALPHGPRGAWSAMLLLGGALALLGTITKNVRIETTGCVLVAAAKLVWVVAALSPGSEFVQGADVLAAILIAGATGTMWRFFGLYVGQYLRTKG